MSKKHEKFENQRYITTGVDKNVNILVQQFLWELIDSLQGERDFLQIFNLEPVISCKDKM
jgi:hypothetical protein